jgi:hypothetical protein
MQLMIRLLCVATLATGIMTSAAAMTLAPLPQSKTMISKVDRWPCRPKYARRRHGVCVTKAIPGQIIR